MHTVTCVAHLDAWQPTMLALNASKEYVQYKLYQINQTLDFFFLVGLLIRSDTLDLKTE